MAIFLTACRDAAVGKTGKTEVLPGFGRIERGAESPVIWWSYLPTILDGASVMPTASNRIAYNTLNST